MAVYTVHEPPPARSRCARRIPSGSSSCATASPGRPSCSAPLWLLRHRLWLALRRLCSSAWRRSACGMRALGCVVRSRRDRDRASVALLVGSRPSTSAALDARAPRLARCVGVVVGDDLEAAERRFFDAWAAPGADAVADRASMPRRLAADRRPATRRATTCIGLFPEPGAGRVTVAIIDYGSGNLHSAAKAFERAAREAGSRAADPWSPAIRTRCAAPTASCCRASAPSPIAAAASTPCPAWSRRWTRPCAASGRPFLGICVGMQLMAERGLEYEVTPKASAGSPARSSRSRRRTRRLKIPHMGWNTLDRARAAPAARRHPARAARAACLFRPLLSPQGRRTAADLVARGRLWRPDHRHRRRATTSPARSSTRRRASDSGLALIANFLSVAAVILFPAIDLKDGLCVRLEQGDMARATVFNATRPRRRTPSRRRASTICMSSISTAPSPASR